MEGGVSGDGKNPKLPWSISKVLAENFAEGEKKIGVLHRVRIRQRAFRDEKSVRTSEKNRFFFFCTFAQNVKKWVLGETNFWGYGGGGLEMAINQSCLGHKPKFSTPLCTDWYHEDGSGSC